MHYVCRWIYCSASFVRRCGSSLERPSSHLSKKQVCEAEANVFLGSPWQKHHRQNHQEWCPSFKTNSFRSCWVTSDQAGTGCRNSVVGRVGRTARRIWKREGLLESGAQAMFFILLLLFIAFSVWTLRTDQIVMKIVVVWELCGMPGSRGQLHLFAKITTIRSRLTTDHSYRR